MDIDRPVLRSIDVALEDQVTVTVSLEINGHEYRGQASGSPDESHRPRVVGEATLRALESALGDTHFTLAAVAKTSFDGAHLALVQVTESARPEAHVGTALIREGDSVLATARAVLNSVNRRLSVLLGELTE